MKVNSASYEIKKKQK